jgi:hypothetical protein
MLPIALHDTLGGAHPGGKCAIESLAWSFMAARIAPQGRVRPKLPFEVETGLVGLFVGPSSEPDANDVAIFGGLHAKIVRVAAGGAR